MWATEAALVRLVVAAAIGGLIGMERERVAGEERVAGVRTFPLFSLLGAMLVLSNTAVKAGYAAWMGSPAFRRATLSILGVAFVVGLIALMLIRG